MRILVTGGAGYVGSSLVENLSHKEDVEQVVVYDNLSRGNFNIFSNRNIKSEKIEFVRGDILDNYLLSKTLDGIDLCYHLAAKVANPEKDIDSQYFEQVNHWGTATLINEIEKSAVKKFIYLSTVYVYGHTPEKADETSPTNPYSFYGISKLRGEGHLQRLVDKIDSYIIRSGSVYGTNCCTRFDILINHFIFQAHYYNRVTIHGNGEQMRPFIHIDKLAHVLTELPASNIEPAIYNMAEYKFSVNDLVEKLKTIYPGMEHNSLNTHIPMRDINIDVPSKIKGVISWPEKSFEDEIRSMGSSFI